MRSGPPSEILAAGASYRVRVDSYLGGDVLASDIHPSGGSVSVSATTQTLESATLVVPAFADGRSWIPGADTRHPLGRFGQELAFTAIMSAGADTWETPLGRLRIDSWREDGGEVEVRCSGVMARVADARLPRPIVPRKDGTLDSELRRLMVAGIPVDVSPSLGNRSCPASFQWEEDRIGAVYDLIDAWPGRLVPDGLGGVQVLPELVEADWDAVLTYADGEGGTVASAPREDTRERIYNHVIARAQSDTASAVLIQGEAKVTTGAYSVTGPYGDVPRFYSSPTLRTVAQCEAAAASLLAKSLRPSRVVEVVAAVDPRVELYDPASVTFDYVRHSGWILGYTLPLVPGDMSLTVSIFASQDLPRPNPDRGVPLVPTLEVTDNGDGTATATGSAVTNNGDGTATIDSDLVELLGDGTAIVYG